MTRQQLALPGVLDAGGVAQTAARLAAMQEASGVLPWAEGEHVDTWNHTESAMALDAAGHLDAAGRAYRWLLDAQRPDGTWPLETRAGVVTDAGFDTNMTAYPAVGVWHSWLLHRDPAWPARAWPMVRAAIDAVVDLQTPRGDIRWARGAAGRVDPMSLLAGCASIVTSLRCALALADLVGEPRPDWELALGRLAHAVAAHGEDFADNARFSMDWYYPVLGGAVRGPAAAHRLRAGWDAFVVPGLGVRCVSDRPWVTGAETCELAMTLAALGDTAGAVAQLASMQHLRHDDGAYWTGLVFDEGVRWPAELSSWTAAAVLLAVDAVTATTPAARVLLGDGLPAVTAAFDADVCGCPSRTGQPSGSPA